PGEAADIFRRTASTPARRLALALAASPAISLPIARLVGSAVLGDEFKPAHLAEVWLGGLLEPRGLLGPGGLLEPLNRSAPVDDPEQVYYEFREGLRARLLEAAPRADALRVLMSVSDYLEKHLGEERGRRFGTLRAMLAAPPGSGDRFDPAGYPFAQV